MFRERHPEAPEAPTPPPASKRLRKPLPRHYKHSDLKAQLAALRYFVERKRYAVHTDCMSVSE